MDWGRTWRGIKSNPRPARFCVEDAHKKKLRMVNFSFEPEESDRVGKCSLSPMRHRSAYRCLSNNQEEETDPKVSTFTGLSTCFSISSSWIVSQVTS